jgi:DNA-binding NtrC family response regulator
VSNRERVLVVDAVSDTADVLQAVLEPRGLTVNRVRRLEMAAPAADGDCPAVLILDAESLNCASAVISDGWQNVPQVIIGKVQMGAETTAPRATRRFLQTPFQFAELVQAIESLIGEEPRAG